VRNGTARVLAVVETVIARFRHKGFFLPKVTKVTELLNLTLLSVTDCRFRPQTGLIHLDLPEMLQDARLAGTRVGLGFRSGLAF
jgi:hypothetical protein